jgi:diaminopimelate decarboxylase
MTLTDLLPSLRSSLRPRLDTGIWPATVRWGTHGDLLVGGVRMTTLAATYGTPAHVLDEADVRARCAEYAGAFGADAVAYSAKAGLTVGSGRWIAEQGLGCYVRSAAELRTALLAGFRAARIVLYGTAKSVMDLDAAYACGAAVVVGSPAELDTVAARAPIGQRVHLRVIASHTGRGRRQYGLRLGSGAALAAIDAVRSSPNLLLAGLDCSLGHQLSRFQAFEGCLREAMAFCSVVRSRCGVAVPALNLGGGHAVAYADGDDGFALTAFAARIHAMLRLSAERYRIDQPRLTVSPGRAIVARAGITLHRVSSVTVTDAGERLVAVAGTGGYHQPDCAAAAECAGRHTVELVGRVPAVRAYPATVVGGPAEAIELPGDVAEGDLLAVAGTGGYHHRPEEFVGRPPVLGVAAGLARTLVPRETLEDLLLRTS